MSLSVAGVWAVGVWDQTVWADGVWHEGAAAVVVTTKGGAASVEKEIRRKHQQMLEKRRQLHLTKKPITFDESVLFVEDGDEKTIELGGKEVTIANSPQPPEFIVLPLDLKNIKDSVTKEIAQLSRNLVVLQHNAKVAEFEERMLHMEEELVALLVLTADEDIDIIRLS